MADDSWLHDNHIGPIEKKLPKHYRGFWCEFNDKGQCLDLVEGNRNESPGKEYVWIQEVEKSND